MQRTAQVRSSQDLGRALAEARAALGQSQAELAERTGVTRDYLAHLESGRTTRLLDLYLRALRRAGARVVVMFDAPDEDPDGAT